VHVTVNLRFPGQYYDKEMGCHYNYFRYYCPGIGRYLTADPIGLWGGLNTYTYALNNPLYWTDPQGLEVLVGQHPAFLNSPNNPFNHAAIVLRPDNPGEFANHPLFQHSKGQWATIGGQAFGDGWGLFGRLTSAFNYDGDSPNNLNNKTRVCSLDGQTDSEFILNLIDIAESYRNNALYDPFPDTFGFTFNSNSYAAGLLIKAGVVPPYLPGIRPGYNRPLPFN
jgi:RHS repeat-associated protein